MAGPFNLREANTMTKASSLIGHKMAHDNDPEITGTVTDILFELSLKKAAFFLADVTTPIGTAPVLLSPTVLALEGDVMEIHAHPDDVRARVDASIHRTKVAIDPSDLPSTFIGPFGNTFSPSMIAALFNARTNDERVTPPAEGDGVWFSELRGMAVRAHVADMGLLSDMILDAQLETCKSVELTTEEGQTKSLSPKNILAERSTDNAFLLSIVQTDKTA